MLEVVASNPIEHNTRKQLSQTKFYEGYSRWSDEKQRYETWDEAVDRVIDMHREYYKGKITPELNIMIEHARQLYKQKRVVGAQRALQFGGEQLLKHHMKMYNCTSTYADRAAAFQEIFYMLLCGAGVGFSVQHQHVSKLPKIQPRRGQSKIFKVTDDIEGWADSAGVMLSSFFEGGGTFPEYEGRRVFFDTSAIRDKGAYISGGFKAPGPEPLRDALRKIEALIERRLETMVIGEAYYGMLRPIDVYDIIMFIADAVLAGGVRRSATICMFSIDDEDMINAKVGDFMKHNPQRRLSNNSAIVVRDKVTKKQFHRLFDAVHHFGEPGFIFTDDAEFTFNPCVEIGKLPVWFGDNEERVSGVQGCNLSEINGGMCETEEDFYQACAAAAVLGTLQAGYTDFKYIDSVSKKIFEKEALIGVSVIGWMSNPGLLMNAKLQQRGATIVKEVNKTVAAIIGINPAARTTCVKPGGNAGVLMMTPSAANAEHSPRFLRNIQVNKELDEIVDAWRNTNPYMVEEYVGNDTDVVISFPVIAAETAAFRKELSGVDHLEAVKMIQQNWIEYGTDEDLCVDKRLRHNVSNTITVPDHQWTQVEDYLFDNRYHFAGVSLLGDFGDKAFNQAPFTEVLTEQQIIDKYGRGAMFASGLIVDHIAAGFQNLWEATTYAQTPEQYRVRGEMDDFHAQWVRRFEKFAENYFDGDMKKTEYCLKDVHLLHRWTKIHQNYRDVNLSETLTQRRFTDIDTYAAQACAGGACEI